MRKRFLSSLLLAASPAVACDYPLADLFPGLAALDGAPAVLWTEGRDPRSEEPRRQWTVDWGDGALFVLVERNCTIRNLRLTVLSPGPMPSETEIARAAEILSVTPLWSEEFAGDSLPEAFAVIASEVEANSPNAETYVILNDLLSARTEGSEVEASVLQPRAMMVPYGSVTTVLISSGWN